MNTQRAGKDNKGKKNKGKWTAGSIAALLLAAGASYTGFGGEDSATSSSNGGSDTCAVSTLPPEAHKQIEDIHTGAEPDDGAADGKHFGNYEGLLPQQDSDYYSEYTVKTPGLNHRGERRLVVGGGSKNDPDVWYYTDDHFESFCEIPDA